MQYSAALQNARMQQTLNYIDVSASFARLKVYTFDYSTLLLDFVLQKPSFSLTGNTLTLLGAGFVAAGGAAVGLAKKARIFDGNGTIVVDDLSVGTENANIILTTAAITIGQPNVIQSGTIVHG